MSDQFAELLKDAEEYQRVVLDKLPKPIASISISRDGKAIEIMLDTSRATYSDWINGEGADIGLLRDHETNKVVGARLPLYAKTLLFGGDGLPDITFRLESEASHE